MISPLHRTYFVNVCGFVVPVDGDDEREPDRSFSGGDADGEDGEHDSAECLGSGTITPEGDKVQVGRVEHKLDSDENEDRIATCQRASEADGKQKGGEQQIAVERVHDFFRSCIAITTAPIMAAVRRGPTISSGST